MDTLPRSWQDSFQLGLTYSVAQFSLVLPRIIAAILILFVGLLLARVFKKIIVRTLETLRLSKMVEKTPLELFLKNAETGQKIEEVIGRILYWLFVFLVLFMAISVLGITPLSDFFDRILSYVPHVFSALFIFLFGVLLAGVVESLVKGSMRSIDLRSGRLFAKVASYGVVTFATLAAVAELGIASELIKILFSGVVFAFALGSGLAIGLGGQHTISRMMDEWYQRTRE